MEKICDGDKHWSFIIIEKHVPSFHLLGSCSSMSTCLIFLFFCFLLLMKRTNAIEDNARKKAIAPTMIPTLTPLLIPELFGYLRVTAAT